MTVLIKTKGVFDPNNVQGAAGWGAVIVAPGERDFTKGGPIHFRIKGSTEAELVAMANGLEAAMNLGAVETGERITFATDCREIVAVLLHLMPSFTAVGVPKIDPALRVRRELREAVMLPKFLDDVRVSRLSVSFELVNADPRALGAARSGMNVIRARAG